ncbi:MAG: response regulator [Candidatus Scalindua sp.]
MMKLKYAIFWKDFFLREGYDVRSAYSGTEAIALLKNEEFDLVLSDYVMTKVSGYDVAMFLDTLEKRPKIGIITGWGEKLTPPEEEGLKVDFIIKKPFDLSELTKHINDVIDVGL